MLFITRARRATLTVAAAATAALALIAPAAASALASASTARPSAAPIASSGRGIGYHHVCSAPAPHHAACLAIMDTNTAGRPLSRAAAAAAGVHPFMATDLQSAYDLPSALLGGRQTIAIVDAYDDPNAEADLAAYRAANNLPPCTTANGCFAKVNQNGKPGPYPPGNAGWAVEESLDLDMVSAVCPNCKIVLVEASTNISGDLFTAQDEAAKLGANVISDSWGAPEYAGMAADCTSHFDHHGVAISVATGDSGFKVSFPASCPAVTAVGGTTLYQDNSARGWGELAWSGAGSGCSAYIAKPFWQHDRLCGKRTVADTAAVADPYSPVAVYDSYGAPGWVTIGGTSVAAPIIAGVYALAGNTASITPAWIYAHHSNLYDVTSGSNGNCGGSYLCTAVKGYDGPTGWGTPHGTGAF